MSGTLTSMNLLLTMAMLLKSNGATRQKMIRSSFAKFITAVIEASSTGDRRMFTLILVSQFCLQYILHSAYHDGYFVNKPLIHYEYIGARKGSTRVMDCPFSCVLNWSKTTDAWRLRVRNPAHNHEPSTARSMHWRWRRIDMDKYKDVVADMLSHGISPRTIIETLRDDYPLLAIQPRDIYNLKQRLHLEFLEGRTPIQALIQAIPEENVWKFRVQTDDNNRVTALLALNRQCFNRWFKNPWVLFMDCTYKTNRYKMPLLDIVGCNAMNSTFYVGFAFLSNERQETYEFVLNNLKTSYEHYQLPRLRTVLTDKEDALINAVKTVFPSANTLICIWHINQRILAKAKPLIRSEFAHIEGDREFNEAVESYWKSMLEE